MFLAENAILVMVQLAQWLPVTAPFNRAAMADNRIRCCAMNQCP